MKPEEMLEECITVHEAAKLYGCSVQYIRAECKRGNVVARHDGKGTWLIHKGSLLAKKGAQ